MEEFRTWGRSRALRLPGPNIGPGTVAVTVVVRRRRGVLTDARDVVGALDDDLGRASPDGHATVLVACVMPDHVHVMMSLDGGGSPLSQYVRQWKTLWSRRLARAEERPFWQRSFYDHWMRKGEEREYALYIAGNPVRKGFVQDWREYPFTRVHVPL
jgi:REP element-mobilizing transposase RayT